MSFSHQPTWDNTQPQVKKLNMSATEPATKPATEQSEIPQRKWQWKDIIEVPQRYHRRGIDLEDNPQSRAISIHQLEVLGRLIKKVLRTTYYPKKVPGGSKIMPDGTPKMRTVGQLTKINISMYEINNLFIKPLTLANNCSYVEVIASKPQDPNL